MGKHVALIVLLITALAHVLWSQKFLQLEKTGTLKTTRYYIGDDITFQLVNDDKGWYTRNIQDIDVDNNRLVFINSVLPIDSIGAIQLDGSSFGKAIGGALQYGGPGIALTSLSLSVANSRPVDWTAIGSAAICSGVGTAIRAASKKKKFKVGKNKRLRVLDLNFGPPVIPDKS